MEYNRNPLQALGHNYTWADYYTFRAHLQLPRPYPRIALKNFSPKEAVDNLSRLINSYQQHLWEKKVEPTFKEKLYQVANIPPQYHTPQMFYCEKAADQENLAYVISNIAWLEKNGKQFYFHGPFAEDPMKAATAILRAAVDAKVSCFCENYPTFLDTVKTWDLEDEKLQRIRTTKLLVLWAVGGEWSTDFTQTQLTALLTIRAANGLSTILVSSMTPAEYSSRYKSEAPGIIVAFKGTKMKETLASLKKEMEA